jgi:uncharacterized protein
MSQYSHNFIGTSNDRLVKLGRRIVYLVNNEAAAATASNVDENKNDRLEQSLQLLVDECRILLEILLDDPDRCNKSNFQIPRVRFGRTDLQMPIITLGAMRFQQEWGDRIKCMNQVGSDVQDNLVSILKYAIRIGMVHIETARGYGCSELQLGVALQQLFTINYCQRSDLIIQTKLPPNKDPALFRKALETSFHNLQVDYVDLFAFHGFNFEEQFDWVFGGTTNGGGCYAVVQEYVRLGKIRYVGFSTHGGTDFICKCIDTDVFDYVNLHYHYFGSYTASGCGNLAAVQLLEQKDMGRFIISPFDKGGRLYAPSRQLCNITFPDAEPMTVQSWWIWNHHTLLHSAADDHHLLPQLHTYTVGAGRPSDLDQPLVAAYLHATQLERTVQVLQTVVSRLDAAKIAALGQDWVDRWWHGLPKSTGSQYLVEHNQIVWIYNNMIAYGLYEFGMARYGSFENNEAKWDKTKSDRENIVQNIGQNAWGFVPGRTLRLGGTDGEDVVDYTADLQHVPADQLARVQDAERFVFEFCRRRRKQQQEEQKVDQAAAVAAGEEPIIPDGWQTAYDLRPWPDYPDRPSRGG